MKKSSNLNHQSHDNNQSESQNNENSERDGTSYEKAFIVGSVPEEYAIIKELCPGCMPIEQALAYHDGKPYDILKGVNLDTGEKFVYYFDISNFFNVKDDDEKEIQFPDGKDDDDDVINQATINALFEELLRIQEEE